MAGYLLVWGQRTQERMARLIEAQGAELTLIGATLARMENLLQFLTRSQPPS